MSITVTPKLQLLATAFNMPVGTLTDILAEAFSDLAASGDVPATRTISTTAPLTGGGDLSANRTIAISDFGASGTNHARGAVPDPGATPGTAKFLREDKSWVDPISAVVHSITAGSGINVTGTSTNPMISAGGTTSPATNLPIDSMLGYSSQLQACMISYLNTDHFAGAIANGSRSAVQIGGKISSAGTTPVQIADSGSRIVAITDDSSNPAFYSDDKGQTWTACTGLSGMSSPAGNIIWNPDSAEFAIFADATGTANATVYAGDGASFTAHDVGVVIASAVVGQWDGTRYCVGFKGSVSSNIELWTAPPNFSAWTQQTLPALASATGVNAFLFDGHNYALFAYGAGNIICFCGTDVTALSKVDTGDPTTGVIANSFASSASKMVIADFSGTDSSYWVSADGGATWTQHAGAILSLSSGNGSVAFNSVDSIFIGVQSGANTTLQVYETASNPTTWTASPNILDRALNLPW